MKKAMPLAVMLLLCLSFYFGRRSVKVAIYRIDDMPPIAVSAENPTYGLPMVEYWNALTLLRTGRIERASETLEHYLDAAVYDARARRPLLQGQDVKILDNALRRVAKYREQFPRPLSRFTAIGSTNQLPVNVYWTAERQSEVDAFLQMFNKN